jgi:hypothetical protein
MPEQMGSVKHREAALQSACGATMRGFGRAVLIAALSGVVSAAAAQSPSLSNVLTSINGPDTAFSSETAFGPEQTTLLPKPVAGTNEKPAVGDPLRAIPLGALPETLARPELSPSRRAPLAPDLVALPAAPAKPGPPPKSEPDHPLLTLLGTIVGRSMEIGVFIDDESKDVIRLKTGQAHGGWVLRSVTGRSANFERGDHREATLALEERGVEPTPPSPVAANPTTERVQIRGNDRMTGPPPVNTMSPGAVPAAAKQKFKRTPRES